MSHLVSWVRSSAAPGGGSEAPSRAKTLRNISRAAERWSKPSIELQQASLRLLLLRLDLQPRGSERRMVLLGDVSLQPMAGVNLISPNGKLIGIRPNTCNNSLTQRLLPLRKLLRRRKTRRLERLGTLRALSTLPFHERDEGLVLIIHKFDQLWHGRFIARRSTIGVLFVIAVTTATIPSIRRIVATRCACFLLTTSIGLF